MRSMVTQVPTDGHSGGRLGFAATRWSVVRAASDPHSEPRARQALGALCEQYWFPLYTYARLRGHQPASAEDQVQGFFTLLLEGNGVAGADPERGRFRNYLLGAFKHHLAHEREKDGALRRGGQTLHVSLDGASTEVRVGFEPRVNETPEQAFERAWALALLDEARRRLRAEYLAADKAALFERLAVFIGGAGPEERYRKIADELDLSEVAVKVAVHRLRRRFGELIRQEAAETVESRTEVEQELSALLAAL